MIKSYCMQQLASYLVCSSHVLVLFREDLEDLEAQDLPVQQDSLVHKALLDHKDSRESQ